MNVPFNDTFEKVSNESLQVR